MANEFFTDEHTSALQKLVREVVNDPTTYLGSKYLPSVALPVSRVRTEVVEATGGLTLEHALGTDPKHIQGFGTRVQEFAPAAYKEVMHWDEKKLLHLRELGQNDPSKRGVRQYIDLAIDQLNRRLEARIELLRWRSIFDGGFTYMGKTFSYGIPTANRAAPLGALWSLDGVNPNNSANPIADIRYWVTGGLARFRKYKIQKMVINPNTSRWILENSNTKQYISSIGAQAAIKEWGIGALMSYLLPGGPAIEVYNSWYQTESVDSNGKINVSDAVYFIGDGEIFFECTLPGGDIIGEFQQTLHLSSGSVDSPGYGKFLVVEENIAPGTKGGPQNPFIDITSGVYGGVNLQRSFDVLTAKVVA